MNEQTQRTVTAFQGGTFVEVPEPSWQQEEDDRIHPPNGDQPRWRATDLEEDVYGDPEDMSIRVIEYTQQRGYAATLWSPEHGMTVWCPTRADLLDLLTGRGHAWLQLGAHRPVAESLQHIRNALISYMRHGSGHHNVDRSDGGSWVDRQRDTEERKRQRTVAKPAAGSGSTSDG